MVVDRDGYEIYDLKGKKTSEFKTGKDDLVFRSDRARLDDGRCTSQTSSRAFATGDKLNAPIAVGNVAVTMLQLSNIAWEVNRELQLDTKDGKIQNDAQAMKMWGREYEKGWAPHL